MNAYKSVDVHAINLVWVDFAFEVDTSYTLIISLWSCCIIATSSSVNSIITNSDRPLAELTKAALFPISDATQSLFTIVITTFGYSGTLASSNM